MIEEIEKVVERPVLNPQPVGYELGVVWWQDADWSGEPHERDYHLGRTVILSAVFTELMNLAGREFERSLRAEANVLSRGVYWIALLTDSPHWQALGRYEPEQPHCLEEVEVIGFVEEFVFKRKCH